VNTILIFRHIACEGPGYLADFFHANNIQFKIVCIDKGEPVPASLDSIGGLVFMGGPMSVNDPLSWVGAECELIRNAHAAGIPVLGHCLGGQLISKALGGMIKANQVREIGWFQVSGYENENARRWLDGLPEEFFAFHLHSETFTIPEGATPLLHSQYCHHQAFAMDGTLALRCHIEVNANMVREWVQVYQDDLKQPSGSVQSVAEILRDLDKRISGMQDAAEKLYGRWIEGIQS